MSAPLEVPPVVRRAYDVSREAGNAYFCRAETGRLLAALAATRSGTLAEFGTGCGVGTAWIRHGAPAGTRILTAEHDPRLAGVAAELFADDTEVEVVAGDSSALRERAPFSLLFLDSGKPTVADVDAVADLVEPGGIVVLDDFTPCSLWPPMFDGRVDTLRQAWLSDERFAAAEVMVTEDASVVLATRRPDSDGS